MLKQRRYALAIVIPPNSFREKMRQIYYDEFFCCSNLLRRNGERVGDDDSINTIAALQLFKGITTEEAMCSHAVNFLCTTAFNHCLCCGDPASSFVNHVVDDENSSIFDITDECDHLF